MSHKKKKKQLDKAEAHARALIEEAVALEDVYEIGIAHIIFRSKYGLTYNESKELVINLIKDIKEEK